MNNKAYVMRHAASLSNIQGKVQGLQDVPLAELGIQQANQAVRICQQLGLKHLISSPLQRAFQTASIIAEYCGSKVQIEPAFRARDLGDWSGKPREEIKEYWADPKHPFRTDPHFAPPKGESLQQADDRVLAAWEHWCQKLEGPILFVMHLVGCGTILQKYSQQRPSLGNAEIVEIDLSTSIIKRIFCPMATSTEGEE